MKKEARTDQQPDDALAFGEGLLKKIGAAVFGIDPLAPSDFHRLPANVRLEVVLMSELLDGWLNQKPMPGWTSENLSVVQEAWRMSGRNWRVLAEHVVKNEHRKVTIKAK